MRVHPILLSHPLSKFGVHGPSGGIKSGEPIDGKITIEDDEFCSKMHLIRPSIVTNKDRVIIRKRWLTQIIRVFGVGFKVGLPQVRGENCERAKGPSRQVQ